tara:strand:+ start:445 stop:645 length:201 start_codon:yes stop_codon:yes gene_type:complete
MSILNYFFIGVAITFVLDLILGVAITKNNPITKNIEWGMTQRTVCVIIWPIASLVFLISFIKAIFK